MTQPFARPHSGDELMDTRTFSELCARLAERAERARAQAQPPAPPRRAAQRIVDLAELGARVVGDPVPAGWTRAPASDGSGVPTAALEAEIDRAADREAVARLAVKLARSYASAAALLLVHRGIIQGLCADGLAGRPDAVMFPAGNASLFGEVAETGRGFRGTPRAGGLDARILRALGREQVREIAVLPVSLGGRAVNLLYADNGPEAFGDASAAALASVCGRVATAYERLIRVHRLGAPRLVLF
jgi:hypothetical protein